MYYHDLISRIRRSPNSVAPSYVFACDLTHAHMRGSEWVYAILLRVCMYITMHNAYVMYVACVHGDFSLGFELALRNWLCT